MTTAETRSKLPKSYTPAEHEGRVRAMWESSDVFRASVEGEGDPFCILIPPPNVTAALHLGHAFNNTLQDILVRYHRMKGCRTLWMPGTDHAGIATQAVVEKRLQSQGKRRTDFTREQFVEMVQAWKDEYEATITEQLKAMGCSCDWARQRFTMDEMCARAVREAFFQLFKAGLIYRGKRLVNWDPVSLTALADDEVEMKEVRGSMWYLRYPLVHPPANPDDPHDAQEVTWSELARRGYPVPRGAGGAEYADEIPAWVTVATTRPETYLGDTAVAINPRDPRAAPLDGLMVQLPIVGRVIPIVQDDYVVLPDSTSTEAKAQFATGFLKVTPAHDPNDWEIGIRHGERIARNSARTVVINVLAPDATISDQHGWQREAWRENGHVFVGMSREEARKKVVAEFKQRGLLENVRDYSHSVGHSYRSHVPIEPYLSDQWYVKVSDDRLVSEAQRALVDEQFEGEKPPRDSGTGVSPVTASSASMADEAVPGARRTTASLRTTRRNLPHWEMGGSVYYITFRVVKGQQLAPEERTIVAATCRHWHGSRMHLHLAVIMPDHVHMLMQPLPKDDRESWWPLSDLLHSIKSFSAHQVQKQRGATGSLWQDESLDRIVRNDEEFFEKFNYMLENPVRAGLVERVEDYPFVVRPDESAAVRGTAERPSYGPARRGLRRTVTGETPVPLSDSAPREGDGELRFFPERYAKMYQSWHDNLRDWCISRQLWWGHRIPVWFGDPPGFNNMSMRPAQAIDESESKLQPWIDAGRIAIQQPRAIEEVHEIESVVPINDPYRICVRDPADDEVVDWLESSGFRQDPDVLDTWFSSGLWPISTMGWPQPESYPNEIPEGGELLETFNPSSVLCTARDIITLWVSRMVMFNRFFRDGKVPFRDVYIHPMIQDGHGQRMSKSLGNGVDPRDIIHTHGADALRFTLCHMATSTQDCRLPVSTVCPHCEATFQPVEITSNAGYRVAAPVQTCPKCGKKMTTLYGVLSGEAEVPCESNDENVESRRGEASTLAMNSSPKFDFGRNFANKLWNATRFALLSLENSAPPTDFESISIRELRLEDRWILTRLHRTLHRVEDAINDYQFNTYAEAMYDFIWREFCDWYLEAIKPTVREDARQQHALRTVLNAIMRLLHPICPFVTEALWPHVRSAGPTGLDGLNLPDGEILAGAAWPDIACKVDDPQADETFTRIQSLVESIRTIRGERKVPVKRRIKLLAPCEVIQLVDLADGVVQQLAGLSEAVESNATPSDGIPLVFEGFELALTDLVDAADAGFERQRLEREAASHEKTINALNARLNNEAYVNKAPAAMVQQTRDQLAAAEAALAAARKALDSIGG